MDDGIRLELPREIADGLVADKVVVRSFVTRGGPISEAVRVVVESVGAGADVVTVAAAAVAVPKVLTRIRERLVRDQSSESARVVMKCGDREVIVEVPVGLPAQEAEELLARSLSQIREQRLAE